MARKLGQFDRGLKMTAETNPRAFIESRVMYELNSGCWLWTGDSIGAGYGTCTIKKQKIRAHRLSYEVHKGPISSGLHVCHKCDTPACVNPDHLFLGTHTDNMRDNAKKGRNGQTRHPEKSSLWNHGFKGENHSQARLNYMLVGEILASEESARVCGERMGVTKATVIGIRLYGWGNIVGRKERKPDKRQVARYEYLKTILAPEEVKRRGLDRFSQI